MDRTALLIRCTVEEAARIRTEAQLQRRTISGYVLHVTSRAVDIEDRLFAKLNRFDGMNRVASRRILIQPGPRTAILVRCTTDEAGRVRSAALRRDIPINAFVLQALKRWWTAEESATASLNKPVAPVPASSS